MKKKFNIFAVALGLLAIAYALLLIPDVLVIVSQPQTLGSDIGKSVLASYEARNILTALRGTIYGSGSLMGLAVVVELVDRIRWDSASTDVQTDRHVES